MVSLKIPIPTIMYAMSCDCDVYAGKICDNINDYDIFNVSDVQNVPDDCGVTYICYVFDVIDVLDNSDVMTNCAM
jgi:hypothetical protein